MHEVEVFMLDRNMVMLQCNMESYIIIATAYYLRISNDKCQVASQHDIKMQLSNVQTLRLKHGWVVIDVL